MNDPEQELESEMIAKLMEIKTKITLLEDQLREAKVRKNAADRLSGKERIVELTQIGDIYKKVVDIYRAILVKIDELLGKFGGDELNQSRTKIAEKISIIEEEINSLDQTIQDAHRMMANHDLENL